MNTTNRFHHINGLLPYKPPPWKQRLRQKLIDNLLGIIYILLLPSSPSNYTIKPSINTGTATSSTAPPHRPLLVLETHHTQHQTKNYSTIPPLPNNRPPHSYPPVHLQPFTLPTTTPAHGNAHGPNPPNNFFSFQYRFPRTKTTPPTSKIWEKKTQPDHKSYSPARHPFPFSTHTFPFCDSNKLPSNTKLPNPLHLRTPSFHSSFYIDTTPKTDPKHPDHIASYTINPS